MGSISSRGFFHHTRKGLFPRLVIGEAMMAMGPSAEAYGFLLCFVYICPLFITFMTQPQSGHLIGSKMVVGGPAQAPELWGSLLHMSTLSWSLRL